MPTVFFITHPDVAIDPGVSVADWPLNKRSRARMHAITTRPWVRRVRHIFASSERKARDAAQILADGLGLGGYSVIANLAENDRKTTERRRASLPRTSSRGPSTRSLRSRNRASGAGSRPQMLRHELLSPSSRPCRKPLSERISPLSGTAARGPCSIAASRGCRSIAAYDQPATNGGNWFAFDRASRKLLRDGWQSIDAAEAALEAANLTIWLPAQSDAIEFRCSAPR